MRIWLKRRGFGLYPYDQDGIEEFGRLPIDKPLRGDVVQDRSLGFHRLYWALCSRVGRGIGRDAKFVDRAFKLATGHCSHFVTDAGREVLVLDSIAFDSMDQIAFREFFEQCVQVMYSRWGVDPKSVADLLVPEGREEQRR